MVRTHFSHHALSPKWTVFFQETAEAIPVPLEVHCLGAFAAAVRYRAIVAYREIEYVATVPPRGVEMLRMANPDSALASRHGLSLRFSGSAEFIDDYDKRLRCIFAKRFGNLRLYAMEAHDLVLTKLGSRSSIDVAVLDQLLRSRLLKPRTLQRRYREGLRPFVAHPQRLDGHLQNLLRRLS